jgi:hypothetical protein
MMMERLVQRGVAVPKTWTKRSAGSNVHALGY